VIIYPPTINWDWMKQRPQHLMMQFALDGHEVYYCNKTQREDKNFSKIHPNLTIVHNNKHFLRHVVPKLKKQGKKILLWVTCAKHYLFSGQYFPDAIVFDYVDDFPAWAPYFEKMLERADLVFTTAKRLQHQVEQQ